MFGISWAEFFVVLLVAVLVIPARNWPDVAKFLARVVRFVRDFIWKITDVTENIKNQIELEKPIDDLIKTTTDEMLDTFSVVKKVNKKSKKISRKGIEK
jgi:Sec-independent protein translocase protein TatA